MICLLILLLVIGVVLFVIPMDAGIRRIIVAIVGLLVVLALLQMFGLLSGIGWHRWGRF